MNKKVVLRPPVKRAAATQDPGISLGDLVKSANAGDATARQLLQQTLDNNPEIWRRVGDLGKQAEEMLFKRIAREDPFLLNCIQRHANDLRAELGNGGPLLERLAVQRIVLCWLELALIDAEHPGGATAGIPQARYVQTAKSAAQRRYESAVRSLMLIREKLGYAAAPGSKPPLKVVPFGDRQKGEGPPAAASA